MMTAIFWLSSLPSSELPDFAWADWIVKKSGHVLGYGLLAASYRHALGSRGTYSWLLAIAYAVTDEFHQSFVPGRGSSILDVLIFDNLGALIGLWIADWHRAKERSA